jgi:hypothetical protein
MHPSKNGPLNNNTPENPDSSKPHGGLGQIVSMLLKEGHLTDKQIA